MEEADVVRIVESSIAKKNESLLASMKSMLERSLTDLKRSHADTADSHLNEIKKLKFDEPHRFKKKGNEDQYTFNLKVGDAIEEAKEACSSQQLDKVHASLEKGEKLLSERQKHILLADKSDFGWSLIREYKRNDLAEDSDDEKKIIRAEARARTQAKQNSAGNKTRLASNRKELPVLLPAETASFRQFYTNSARPIPTIHTSTQTKPGSCFPCNKPGHWRAQCPLNSSTFQPAQWLAADRDDQGKVQGVVNSIFASNDLSDNCYDEISHSNDLDAVVELKSLLNYEFTSGQPNTPSVRGRLALCAMTSG